MMGISKFLLSKYQIYLLLYSWKYHLQQSLIFLHKHIFYRWLDLQPCLLCGTNNVSKELIEVLSSNLQTKTNLLLFVLHVICRAQFCREIWNSKQNKKGRWKIVDYLCLYHCIFVYVQVSILTSGKKEFWYFISCWCMEL